MTEDYEDYNVDPYEPDYTDFTKLQAREDYDLLNAPLPLDELVERVTATWGNTWSQDKILRKCKRWREIDCALYARRLADLGLV